MATVTTITVKTKWDYPTKEGYYFAFSKEFNDWVMCKFSGGIFYAAGSPNIEISTPNSFNYPLNKTVLDVEKYRYLATPKL